MHNRLTEENPINISLMSLILSPKPLQNALQKVLNEANTPIFHKR